MSPKDYIDLRIEEAKSKGSEALSKGMAAVLSWMLIVAVLLLVLTTLAFALILLLGKVLDNYALGAFIVCGFFLIILILLFLLRGKLFRNSFARSFSGSRNYKELHARSEKLGLMAETARNDYFDWGGIALRSIGILRRIFTKR